MQCPYSTQFWWVPFITRECISSLEAVGMCKHSFQEGCDALSHTDSHCSWVLLWTRPRSVKAVCVFIVTTVKCYLLKTLKQRLERWPSG